MVKKKKLLWGTTLISLLIILSTAFAITENITELGWSDDSGINWFGMVVQPTQDINVSGIIRAPGNTAALCKIFDYNKTGTILNTLGIGTTNGTDSNFNPRVALTKDVNYVFACGNADNSSNHEMYRAITLPVIGTNIKWVGRVASLVANGTGFSSDVIGQAKAIKGVTYTLSIAPLSIDANFSYVIDKPNASISFTDTSTDVNVTINDWNWSINGTKQSDDQNYTLVGSQNIDYNTCLKVGGLGTDGNTYTSQYCKTVSVDTINPTIDGNLVYTQGFTSAFNITYNLICYDNSAAPITYQVIKNDTNYLLNEGDVNATLNTASFTLNYPGSAEIVMKCVDDGNNFATLSFDKIYALKFRLVNENTGALFDLNKVTAAQAFTYDGNFIYNFKDANLTSTNFFSPSRTVRFDFTYPDADATKISREINFDYITDENVGVCVAEYQQFYLYRFLSTSVKPVVVYNDFAKCYNLASTTKFLYNTYQSNTAYTINKPYYLYTYTNGVKTLLALLDGANNTEINLDILAFNQQTYVYSIDTDQIVFIPSETDLNTIVLYFTSPNDNESVTLQIYNGNTLLWNYTELVDTNLFQVNFFYGDSNVTDTNLLKIVVTVVNDGETSSFYKWFNTRAESYAGILNPIVAIVLSFFVLFFGVTMVSYRFAMGWFGLFISFVAIGILALAPMYDYIIFLMAIYFIIGIFIGVIGREQTLGVSS